MRVRSSPDHSLLVIPAKAGNQSCPLFALPPSASHNTFRSHNNGDLPHDMRPGVSEPPHAARIHADAPRGAFSYSPSRRFASLDLGSRLHASPAKIILQLGESTCTPAPRAQAKQTCCAVMQSVKKREATFMRSRCGVDSWGTRKIRQSTDRYLFFSTWRVPHHAP